MLILSRIKLICCVQGGLPVYFLDLKCCNRTMSATLLGFDCLFYKHGSPPPSLALSVTNSHELRSITLELIEVGYVF
jgi:hypothetical protein